MNITKQIYIFYKTINPTYNNNPTKKIIQWKNTHRNTHYRTPAYPQKRIIKPKTNKDKQPNTMKKIIPKHTITQKDIGRVTLKISTT